MRRLVDTARSLGIGPAADPTTTIGPLIDRAALDKVRSYVELGKTEAELVCEVDPGQPSGYFAGPVIFDRVAPKARIATEEIFGPVLTVIESASGCFSVEALNSKVVATMSSIPPPTGSMVLVGMTIPQLPAIHR